MLFFRLRISELLALRIDDIKLTVEAPTNMLAILIRGPKIDQEKRGATRAICANSTLLFPAKAAEQLASARDALGLISGVLTRLVSAPN